MQVWQPNANLIAYAAGDFPGLFVSAVPAGAATPLPMCAPLCGRLQTSAHEGDDCSSLQSAAGQESRSKCSVFICTFLLLMPFVVGSKAMHRLRRLMLQQRITLVVNPPSECNAAGLCLQANQYCQCIYRSLYQKFPAGQSRPRYLPELLICILELNIALLEGLLMAWNQPQRAVHVSMRIKGTLAVTIVPLWKISSVCARAGAERHSECAFSVG